ELASQASADAIFVVEDERRHGLAVAVQSVGEKFFARCPPSVVAHFRLPCPDARASIPPTRVRGGAFARSLVRRHPQNRPKAERSFRTSQARRLPCMNSQEDA